MILSKAKALSLKDLIYILYRTQAIKIITCTKAFRDVDCTVRDPYHWLENE